MRKILDEIKPETHRRLIDLVAAAGVDVTAWADYRGAPGANPKYCYNWSFVEPGKVVVLNLWHADLRDRRGVITTRANMRRRANNLREKRDPQSARWRRRSEEWDAAIQTALTSALPIRAVIIDGHMRDAEDSGSARVKRRLLDPVYWGVKDYDPRTGACTLQRGIPHAIAVDQFVLEGENTGSAERRAFTGELFVRDPSVRLAALLRANGRCEWCGEIGFCTVGGAPFLETHHIVPLGEGGLDRVSNVAALCPNHHREAHHGAGRDAMRHSLLRTMGHKQARASRMRDDL